MATCKCGQPSHPAYGTRCEDCFSDDQERAAGRFRERPTEMPSVELIGRRAKTGRDIWTGRPRESNTRADSAKRSAKRSAKAVRLRAEGLTMKAIGALLGISQQAAQQMIARAMARRAKAEAATVDPRTS